MSEAMWNLTGRRTCSCRLKDISSSLASNHMVEVGILERGVRRRRSQAAMKYTRDLQVNGYGLWKNHPRTRHHRLAKRYRGDIILITLLHLSSNIVQLKCLSIESKCFLHSRAFYPVADPGEGPGGGGGGGSGPHHIFRK